MIFINKRTGEIYELLIQSLVNDGFKDKWGYIAYGIGKFCLQGETEPREMLMSDMADNFELLGFL